MALPITQDNFQTEILEAELPVLLDFYADWCGPCKMMAPIVDSLAAEYDGRLKVGKLNVDTSPEVAQRYRIMSIPTLLFFRDGQVVETVVGATSKAELEAVIHSVLL